MYRIYKGYINEGSTENENNTNVKRERENNAYKEKKYTSNPFCRTGYGDEKENIIKRRKNISR